MSRGCGQLNACTSHLHIILLYTSSAHDCASLLSTVSHVTRRAKLEWRRKNAQLQSEDQQ